MRKVSLMLLLVVLSTVIAVGSAFAAGVIGTPHDVTSAIGSATPNLAGACSVCHIPHKSPGGNRLWASAMVTPAHNADGTMNSMGVVGQFCGYCHTTEGGSGLSNAARAEFAVYTGTGHDLDTTNYYVVTSGTQDVAASGLPYTTPAGTTKFDKDDTNFIQCTSCHNVHDNITNRPFLRASIRDLCIRCHITRAQSAGSWLGQGGATLGTWGTTYMQRSNPGSHPVGTDVTGDNAGTAGNSPIGVWTAAPWDAKTATLMQLFDDDNGTKDVTAITYGVWNLGLHVVEAANRADGVPAGATTAGEVGGVVCVSCHAVHGVQDDSSATLQVLTNDNLLARIQGSMTIASSVVLNGNGDLNNALCEACHWRTGTSTFTPNGGSYTLGSARPNPGGTAFTHPMDDAPVQNPAGVTVPALWPKSSVQPGNTTGLMIICESCHVPHGDRSIAKARGDVSETSGAGTTGAYILRDSLVEICGRCHSATGELTTNHHPTGDFTANGAMTAASINNVGNGDALLTCTDCHGDSNNGAHNWTAASQVGMDKDWIPNDNGRGAADVVGQAISGLSNTCEKCHYLLTGPAGSAANAIDSPTIDGYAGITGQGAGTLNAEYQQTGTGTHYLGILNDTAADYAVRAWTNGVVHNGTGIDSGFDPRASAWPNGRTTPGWSRWGTAAAAGAGKNLVCESCHELEPDKNAVGSKLLLYFFAEGTTGPRANDNAGTSYFCEGCHGVNGPKNTHALTGDTVTRTNLALSTNTTGSFLATDAPTATPSIAGTPGAGYSSFPGANQVSCDSCHQTHDANSDSGTYILDAPEGNASATTSAQHAGNGGANANGHVNTPVTPTNLDYTGFCDQCHRYTKTN